MSGFMVYVVAGGKLPKPVVYLALTFSTMAFTPTLFTVVSNALIIIVFIEVFVHPGSYLSVASVA